MSSTNGLVVKKRKQKLVKHKRKNWKKTDIEDVEQGIEELKQEIRTGGLRSEKKDDELFFIDKSKKEKIKQDETNENKLKTLEDALNDLRCYKNLGADANSEKALLRNNKTKLDNSKRTLKRKLIEEEKTKKKTDGMSLRPRKKPLKNEITFEHDLWSTNLGPEVNHTNEYFLKTTKQLRVKKPKNFDEKPSALPAVEVPHPGTSYNPTYEEHQELLLKAHEIEVEKTKKEEKLKRNLDMKITKMTHGQIESLWLSEMSELIVDGGKSEDLVEEFNQETIQLIKTKKKKESKNEKLEKLKAKQREEEKQQRIRDNEIYRLRTIKKEIKNEEDKINKLKEKRELAKKNKKLYGQMRLAKLRYEEPEIDLKLSDEITGNLRTLKPEGHGFVDRYKSLQKRNIIEPRHKAKKTKKYWTKTFEKKSVKEITA